MVVYLLFKFLLSTTLLLCVACVIVETVGTELETEQSRRVGCQGHGEHDGRFKEKTRQRN